MVAAGRVIQRLQSWKYLQQLSLRLHEAYGNLGLLRDIFKGMKLILGSEFCSENKKVNGEQQK